MACRQRMLTPPDTEFRPIGICICSTFGDQSFSQAFVIFPDYTLRTPFGTFSILLMKEIETVQFRLGVIASRFFFLIHTGKWSLVKLISYCETWTLRRMQYRIEMFSLNWNPLRRNFYSSVKGNWVPPALKSWTSVPFTIPCPCFWWGFSNPKSLFTRGTQYVGSLCFNTGVRTVGLTIFVMGYHTYHLHRVIFFGCPHMRFFLSF